MDTSPSSNNFYSRFLSYTFLANMLCIKKIGVVRNVQSSEFKPRLIDTPTTSWCNKKNRLGDGRFWDLLIFSGMLNYIQHNFLCLLLPSSFAVESKCWNMVQNCNSSHSRSEAFIEAFNGRFPIGHY